MIARHAIPLGISKGRHVKINAQVANSEMTPHQHAMSVMTPAFFAVKVVLQTVQVALLELTCSWMGLDLAKLDFIRHYFPLLVIPAMRSETHVVVQVINNALGASIADF